MRDFVQCCTIFHSSHSSIPSISSCAVQLMVRLSSVACVKLSLNFTPAKHLSLVNLLLTNCADCKIGKQRCIFKPCKLCSVSSTKGRGQFEESAECCLL